MDEDRGGKGRKRILYSVIARTGQRNLAKNLIRQQ